MEKLIGHTATTLLTGRRRFANDDLQVLQSHFEAFERQFQGKGAFVISGGAISGTTGAYNISSALVFLNGKVIAYQGASNISITANTKLVEDSPELLGERTFDLISEERAGIIKYRAKITDEVAIGDSIPLTTIGFTNTYENVYAELLYPAIYNRASLNILPLGVILMWSGSIEQFDETGRGKDNLDGWALCNGINGTPDMRGRFMVGYDPNVLDYNSPAKTGGLKEVRLTVEQLPSHRHTEELLPGKGGLIKRSQLGSVTTALTADAVGSGVEPDVLSTPINDEYIGSDSPHENRPPYFVVCYIMKTKIASIIPSQITIPSSSYCNLQNEQIIGVWTTTGNDLITKYFNGSWWLFEVFSYSPLQLIPRGRNMALRSDVTPINVLPLQSCFAAEDTSNNGLSYPSSFVTPEGWETFMVGDTKLIRRTAQLQTEEIITFEINVI